MTDPRVLFIPEEREHHPRSGGPSAYSMDEGVAGDDEGGLAFFTPSTKGNSGPSYVGPAPRRTTWQRWRAWWKTSLGS